MNTATKVDLSGLELLTRKQIEQRYDIKKTTFNNHKRKGGATFPKEVKLGPRNIKYARGEVERWIDSMTVPGIQMPEPEPATKSPPVRRAGRPVKPVVRQRAG